MKSFRIAAVRVPRLAAGCLFTLTSATLHAQGPLNPPGPASLPFSDRALDSSGSPVPSMKTLTQTDPGQPIPSRDADQPELDGSLSAYTITKPGNYYLSGNLIGPKPIVIDSDDVTLDLRGYLVQLELPAGAPGSTGAAIDSTSGTAVRKNITVRNGHIRGSWLIGVRLGDNARVFDLQVDGVQTYGVTCTNSALIERCVVKGPPLPIQVPPAAAWAGIDADDHAIVRACTADGIWAVGIQTQRTSRIVDSVAANCLGCGIVTNSGGSLSGCTAFNNGVTGIDVATSNSILNSAAFLNGGEGFHMRGGCSLMNCSSRENKEEGYNAENLAAPGSNEESVACNFFQCVAQKNSRDGFKATVNCHFAHCTADRNGSAQTPGGPVTTGFSNGFIVTDGSHFNSCQAISNYGSGIRGGLNNRIEGCTCRANGNWGIEITNDFNVVIRNLVQGNTTGRINVPTGRGVAPVEVSLGASTNPNANLSY